MEQYEQLEFSGQLAAVNPWQSLCQLLLYQPPHLFVGDVSGVLSPEAADRLLW